jgi:hypothetical protein
MATGFLFGGIYYFVCRHICDRFLKTGRNIRFSGINIDIHHVIRYGDENCGDRELPFHQAAGVTL